MAEKKSDPTVKSTPTGPDYPEGTHPLRPLSEQVDAATNKSYKDNPDKPDPTTIAQVEVEKDGR